LGTYFLGRKGGVLSEKGWGLREKIGMTKEKNYRKKKEGNHLAQTLGCLSKAGPMLQKGEKVKKIKL